ncbi:MAG: hypothetical protein KME13_17250 [Myxacorys californica WJT36-NPBG1]|jgi:hypothetical protein|nr:hypothetical protein [Myxacorys californica WJT36-NPBG1]
MNFSGNSQIVTVALNVFDTIYLKHCSHQRIAKESKVTNSSPENNQPEKTSVGRDLSVGRDFTPVGRDYIRSTTVTFWFSFFIIGVLALGGLAWAFNAGLITNLGNSQSPQMSPKPTQQLPSQQ